MQRGKFERQAKHALSANDEIEEAAKVYNLNLDK
jgi:hypothetical protein